MKKEKKTEIMKVVLTPSIREQVETRVEEEGKSVSGWIREIIIRELKNKGE